MIDKEKRMLGDVPALFVYKNDITEAAKNGCILFSHGLRVSKEIQITELEDLARHGFLAVCIDNVGHGERCYSDFEARFAETNPHVEQEFLTAVYQTAKDIPKIIDILLKDRLIDEQKIGMAGISMGGYITYTAVTLEPRLKVAASILGSPQWKLDLAESPHQHINRFNTIRLISQNAGKDEAVPPIYAKNFHEQLKTHYNDYDERFAYFEYPHSPHMMAEDDWYLCWGRTVDWFKHHFPYSKQP